MLTEEGSVLLSHTPAGGVDLEGALPREILASRSVHVSDQSPKVKGVVDIVFLIDITGSMQTCIDALRENVMTFVNTLTAVDGNNSSPVKDWRVKAVGYRDVSDGDKWFADNPFVRSADAFRSQLNGFRAEGGGDVPESLLEALYTTISMQQGNKDESEPAGWRHRHDAARVVIVFTDAPYHPTMVVSEGKGGTFSDVINLIHRHKIILSIFAPDMSCYDDLSAADKVVYNGIPYDAADKDGAAKALQAFCSNADSFRRTMEALAKSVSKSATVEAL
jgi:hypothetical protein